jgi:hypothetical protein
MECFLSGVKVRGGLAIPNRACTNDTLKVYYGSRENLESALCDMRRPDANFTVLAVASPTSPLSPRSEPIPNCPTPPRSEPVLMSTDDGRYPEPAA